MVCGIYQISNTVNGKSYIGQSRNIYKRWKQHTRRLDKPNVLEMGSYPLICNVLPPKGINNGELWGADDLSLLEVFYLALQAKVEYE